MIIKPYIHKQTYIGLTNNIILFHDVAIYFSVEENKSAKDLCELYNDPLTDPSININSSTAITNIEYKTFSAVRLSSKTKHVYSINYNFVIHKISLFFVTISSDVRRFCISINIPRFIYKLFIKRGSKVTRFMRQRIIK